MSATGSRVLRVVVALLACASPVRAQLSDAFFHHFGAIQSRELGVRWSVSFGAMLMSQYGSSWDGPPGDWSGPQDFTNYDGLSSTVGYNYFTGGAQWEWLWGPGTAVLEGSATLGLTSDVLTEWFQDGVHNFLRLPHVYRVPEESGDFLAGAELTGSYWLSWYFGLVDFQLYPTVGILTATYHREAFGGLGASLRLYWLKLQASGTTGRLFGHAALVPPVIGSLLKNSYGRAQIAVTLERSQLGALRTVLPIPGVGLTWSSGIFPNEREFLISVFLEVPSFVSNQTLRIEHTNDFVNDTPNGLKDRGPTGALRFTYVAR